MTGSRSIHQLTEEEECLEHLLGLDLGEWKRGLEGKSLPGYRGEQIRQWVYQRGVRDFSAMTNLPKDLREMLGESCSLREGELKETLRCEDGTVKLLLYWPDGAMTETVLMFERSRRTVCVSSQAGCPVRCRFCASGLAGLERSLSSGEIVEQVIWAREQLEAEDRISNVVVMGMGEPLANYDATLKAVKIINADWGLGIGARHITISTIGLPDKIRQLAKEPYQITLAVSLHAGNDQLRGELIPWARRYPLENLFEAIDDYYRKTHREVTLEYVMLEGVNSLPRHADELARWAKRSRCNVNLINYNQVEETGYRPVGGERMEEFKERLQSLGVNVHIRKSRGGGIEAACGQLRRRKVRKGNI